MLRIMCAVRLGVLLFCVFGCFSAAEAASGEDRILLELAEERFGLLMPAEKELFIRVSRGEGVDRRVKPLEGNESLNDPNEAEKWGNERVIRSKCIKWLCMNPKASRLVTHKGIQVAGVRFEGELDLSFVKIPFPLAFLESTFTKKIDLQRAEVRGLYLDGTHTREIRATDIKVNGPVYLHDGFNAKGKVGFIGATIGGDLNCVNAKFDNPEGTALSCDRIKVEGNVFLKNGFSAKGKVRFLGAIVEGTFDCSNGKFNNPKGTALNCDRIEVKDGVFLRNEFKAEGTVWFSRATIGTDLDCANGTFNNPKGIALICDGIDVKNVFLSNDFKAVGEVRFLGAKVGGNFDCQNGIFSNPEGMALNCDRIEVQGNLFLRKWLWVAGKVDLTGARVGGYFIWAGFKPPEETTLDLRAARVGVLWDDERSWPEKGRLFLHGFVYDEIEDDAPRDAGRRLEWLGLQGEYSPGPYEQLAKVLRESGDEDAAKTVLVAKNEEKAKQDDLTGTERIWYKFFGPMIGYGYRPWRALRYVAGFIVAGWILFGIGRLTKVVTPTHMDAYNEDGDISENYPKFNFLVYSVDMFVPLVNLHQAEYWLPNANKGFVMWPWGVTIRWGGFLRMYLWFHIAAGWVLTTLLVVGLTGLVSK